MVVRLLEPVAATPAAWLRHLLAATRELEVFLAAQGRTSFRAGSAMTPTGETAATPQGRMSPATAATEERPLALMAVVAAASLPPPSLATALPGLREVMREPTSR